MERWTERQKAAKAERRRRGLPPGDPRHGSATGYGNWGCRCEPCRGAWSAYSKKRKENGISADDHRHGTATGYNQWGCRCEPCSKAAASYQRSLRYEWNNKAEEAFHLAQNCEICDKQFESSNQQFVKVVDHCHTTNKVRGFICAKCNKILGLANDDPRILRACAEYLENQGAFDAPKVGA